MASRMRALLPSGAVGAPPQRWAVIAGWACLLLPLPSVVWRLAMLAGADVGFAEADLFRSQPGGILYVLALDVAEVVVGLLCLGLILPWGERIPHRAPGLGGAIIPRWIPATITAAGLALMVAIWGGLLVQFVPAWLGLTGAWTPDRLMSGPERALLLACYIPFLVWPLAIASALIGYWRRRAPRPVTAS